MVVFTCQHCGDPVKKPVVEKHYNTKCRFRSPHLTCVDCLKDFSSDDYGSHNQCMTELQRYSAQGTVFKEPKGKKKQEQYIEMIQNILNTKDLSISQEHRKLLEVCSMSDNVPRKIKPFENFLRNKVRQATPKDIHFVFTIIDDAWKSQNQQGKGKEDREKKVIDVGEEVKGNEVRNGETHNKTKEEIATNTDIFNKSKKKRHSDKSLSLDNDEVFTSEKISNDGGYEKVTNDVTNVMPNKAKKKKQCNKSVSSDDLDQVNGVSIESSKTTKKKHREKLLCLDNEDANQDESYSHPDNENATDSKDMNNDDVKENVNKISKKQLKKQKKYEKYLAELECQATSEVNENPINAEEEESNHIKKKKKKNKKTKTSECESDSLAFTEEKNAVNTNDLTVNSNNTKNKKRKLEESGNETQGKKMKEFSEEGEEGSTGLFNWGNVIIKILQSRPDKELSLKKLGKKVVTEYQVIKQDHRTYEELLCKFNKKVSKIKGVRVLRDRAKLIE